MIVTVTIQYEQWRYSIVHMHTWKYVHQCQSHGLGALPTLVWHHRCSREPLKRSRTSGYIEKFPYEALGLRIVRTAPILDMGECRIERDRTLSLIGKSLDGCKAQSESHRGIESECFTELLVTCRFIQHRLYRDHDFPA